MINPFDYTSYYCVYCRHHWVLEADRAVTDKETEDWWKEVLKQHYNVCITYRKAQNDREN